MFKDNNGVYTRRYIFVKNKFVEKVNGIFCLGTKQKNVLSNEKETSSAYNKIRYFMWFTKVVLGINVTHFKDLENDGFFSRNVLNEYF